MVSSLNDSNNNVVQKGLKVKDRDRKTRSFIQRLGLGPANSKQQQQPFPPPLPTQATNAIHNNNITFTSNQTRPVLSSPRLLAAFGHNQGIGAPGQHPSNYPLHMVSALERAGVPLPASDLVRRSFEIPTPNEGTTCLDDGVPKIRLNLSDVCSPFDLISDLEPEANTSVGKQSPALAHSELKSTVHPMPTAIDGPETQVHIASSRRHPRQKVSPRKKRMSKFSISTDSTVSSSEFSLSVALAPPDCTNVANQVHSSQNLVSAYAVAHAHASALGSPLAISTASLSVRGGMIRRAISTSDLELAHEGSSTDHDKDRQDLNSHVLKISKSTQFVSDADSQIDDVLLHTPVSRTSKMDDRKRHNFNLTDPISEIETLETKPDLTQCNNRTSFKGRLTASHKMQCKHEDQSHHQMICAEDTNLTPRNAHEKESPPINAGTTTTNNGVHGVGKRKRIKSVVNMAVAAAIASQNDHAIDICRTPQTPQRSIQPRTQEAKKRYQGSPPPKCEEIASPIEAVPSTPMQYLRKSKAVVKPSKPAIGEVHQLDSRPIGLRSMNIISQKCETEMKQSKACARTTNESQGTSTVTKNASNMQASSNRMAKDVEAISVKNAPKPIEAHSQYDKNLQTSMPVQINKNLNSAAKTEKISDIKDTNKQESSRTSTTIESREKEEEEAKFPAKLPNKNEPDKDSKGDNLNSELRSIKIFTQASNDVKFKRDSSLQESCSAQEDEIQWQFVNTVGSSMPRNVPVGEDMQEHVENSARRLENTQKERLRRSYYRHRSTEEDERRRSVYSAFERKDNNAGKKEPSYLSANENALDSSATLQTNKQISSHKKVNQSREVCMGNFSDKGNAENYCHTYASPHKDAHEESSSELQAKSLISHTSQEESYISSRSPASRRNSYAMLVPPNAQQIFTNQKPEQTNVRQTRSQLEESSIFVQNVHENCLEELNFLQSDVRLTQEDLRYRRQIGHKPYLHSQDVRGISAKKLEDASCTSIRDSKILDKLIPQIKAQNELKVARDFDNGDGLFSSRSKIHRWALNQTWNDNGLHQTDWKQSCQKLRHELGTCGTDKLFGERTEKSMGKIFGSESELASVFDDADKIKVSRTNGDFNEFKYKDKGTFAKPPKKKDQTSPPYLSQSRTRSYTLSSLYQSVGESRPSFVPDDHRQSISSIAPTLVTALASLPSDRFLEPENDLSTNVNLSSWSLSSSAEEFEIPGSFDNPKSSQRRKRTMAALQRSKSLQSLIRRREKKQPSSPLRSPEGSASDTFKSACSENVIQQQKQASSSRTAPANWQEEIYSEEGSVTSPRLLMMQKQKAQLRASHLIDNPSTPGPTHEQPSSRQTSFFDQISTEHEEEEEIFWEAHRVHRRCSSDITSHNALLKGLGVQSEPVKTEQLVSPPARPVRRSRHVSKSSATFLNDLGCWMEETEEMKTDVLNDRKAIVEEIASCASMSGEQFETAIEDNSVNTNPKRRSAAPPVPPRRRVKNRDLADLDDNAAPGKVVSPVASGSSDSWSRLSKVPMYVRLGHLPNRLIDAPSTMSWRSRIGQVEYNDLLQKFDQREMHRQEVIEELYVTEHNFIVQVTSILRTFSEPLRFSDYAFHDSVPVEVARLFHDLDVILAVHVRMFKALDANIKAHPSSLVVSLADAIKPMIDSLAAYQAYLIRYDSVIKLLESLSISSDKGSLSWFVETMDKQASLDECKGLGFGSFLLKPVQRLMKYPLFFKQLDELMDEAHPDKKSTTSLYRATERLIGNMNGVKAREEDFDLISSLEQRISGLPEGMFLANRQRKLIKQGEIRCVRLTEMERLTLLERSKWESPNVNGQSPLLSCFDSAHHSSLRRLSLIGSSPGSSPALLENEPGLEFGSASGCSTSSVSASTPSAGSNVTISSTMTSPALSSTYFDFKVSDEAGEKESAESNSQAPKRKSVAGFLLRGSNANQTPHLPSPDASNKSVNRVHEEEELYVFVFDDICVLTKRDPRSLKVKKKGSAPTTQAKRGPNNVKEDLDTYTALGYIGMSKILAVQQWKNALMGHSDVLEVELMPMKSEFGSKNGLTGTITFYFEFDSATNQGSQWHQSFERSFCTSIQARKERTTAANNSTKEMDKKVAAQLEWRRREKHIAEVVNNAALAVDRVNLAALLQAGLPFPRSPSQQNLADVAFRTAAKIESCGLDVGKKSEAFIDRQRATSNGQAFSTSPTSPNPIRPSLSKLRHANSNPSLRQASQAAALSASRQIDVEGIPRIGDMNAMCGGAGVGAIVSWEQDRQEERKWWRLRLREVEKEIERQEEVDKMVELRRSRVSMPSPSIHPSNLSAFDQSHFSPNLSASMLNNNLSTFDKINGSGMMDAFYFATPSPARTVRTNKVRKGLPILKIN